MSLNTPWLVVNCTTPEITNSIQGLLQNDFALIELKHETHEVDNDSDCFENLLEADKYSITITSETSQSNIQPSTLFVLQRNNTKIVAKALCTYCNGEMNSVGPTLELLEVAKKWRRHGLGLALMEAIEQFTQGLCAPIMDQGQRVLFSVCYVTNAYASKWFQEHCQFRDLLDGMGEELGKYL